MKMRACRIYHNDPSNGSIQDKTVQLIFTLFESETTGLARTRPICYMDIIRALDTIKPSVSEELKMEFVNFLK